MDIETLKEALGSEKFATLQAYVTDLVGQRDAARNESISGRKGLKTENEALKAFKAKALEKLGLDSDDELDSMPDAKGAAEAAKQFEARVKRLERDLAEANKTRDEATGKYRSSLQRAAVADALGGHEFVARDIVESYVANRLTWEGDEVFFKADDGKLVSVKDGVAGVAKSRPELLKPTGTGGAGARQPGAGGAAGKTMTRAEFESLPPTQRVEAAKAGVQLT